MAQITSKWPHRGVGVPVLADVSRVAGLAPHHQDLGILAHADVVGMDEDLAEAAGKGLVALDAELLVAEEDDAVLVQRLADLGHRAVVEILSDVNAGDLGAAGAGEQAYVEPRVAHDRGFLAWPQAIVPRLQEGARRRSNSEASRLVQLGLHLLFQRRRRRRRSWPLFPPGSAVVTTTPG